jgi:catechol-2,3-dioxygenase
MAHIALAVRDRERSRHFYETYFGFEPDYVSVKCRDPDGYVVEFSWEP